jgi:uncharacterized protein YyaL (SSP411 family)
MIAAVMLRLSGLAQDARYTTAARESIELVVPQLRKHPLASGQWLQALAVLDSAPREIAIIGDLQGPDTSALLAVAQGRYAPFQVVAAGLASRAPLLAGKTSLNGRATAYVCAGIACLPPITEADELARILEG